jgi:hypothetical protein
MAPERPSIRSVVRTMSTATRTSRAAPAAIIETARTADPCPVTGGVHVSDRAERPMLALVASPTDAVELHRATTSGYATRQVDTTS